MRELAVLTGTIKNLETWKSKGGLILGKLDLELNEGISIRGLIFPDDWKKLKPHLENEIEITAVGKIDLMNDYTMIIYGITLFRIYRVGQGEKSLNEFLRLIRQQQEKEYKPGWLVYRLKELNPPLPIWKLCAQYLEYLGRKEGWGFYQWRELNPKKEKSVNLDNWD